MSEAIFRCVRCGRDVYKRGAACNDCRASDPTIATLMATAAQGDLRRLAAREVHMTHRPAPA